MTDLHHHQEGSSAGRGRNRLCGGRDAVWRKQSEKSSRCTALTEETSSVDEVLHPDESLQSLIFVLVPSVLHRPMKFLRSHSLTT